MLTTALSLLSLATTALSIPLQLPFLSSSSSPTSALNLHPNSSTRPVRVSLGVMSRCPDASICEALWDRVLEERLPGSFGAPASVVSDLVDMELVFVAQFVLASFSRLISRRQRADARRSRSENASAPYGATCMHGEQECRGNVQQLCAAAHWSTREGEGKKEKLAVEEEELEVALKGKQGWEDWWNVRLEPLPIQTSPVRPGIDTGTRHTQFVQCMNYGDTTKIGSEAAAKQCARVVGRGASPPPCPPSFRLVHQSNSHHPSQSRSRPTQSGPSKSRRASKASRAVRSWSRVCAAPSASTSRGAAPS